MIENLQDELYELENKQAKGAKLRPNIRSWRAKNAPKRPLKYLKGRIWKIKQYLNYILMIINQNILKSAKKMMKLYTKWTSTAATTEFVCKIPNRKKISNEHFNLCEAEISLDEIIKSRNSEANNKPLGNDYLTAEFFRHFSNELAPVLLGVYTGGKTSKISWLFASNLILSISEALEIVGSTLCTPALQLQRQLNYTKRFGPRSCF